MAGAWRWDARDCHVVVADRFYLFDSEVLGKPIELTEQLIQTTNDLKGLHARRNFPKADDVGKNNGSFLEAIRELLSPFRKRAAISGGRMFLNRFSERFLACSILPIYSVSNARSDCLRNADAIRARKIIGLNGLASNRQRRARCISIPSRCLYRR